MKLNWKTNKEIPLREINWKNNSSEQSYWWELYVISSKFNFIGKVCFARETNDENGDILSEACVSDPARTIKINWSDIDYWISENELQKFLLNDIKQI